MLIESLLCQEKKQALRKKIETDFGLYNANKDKKGQAVTYARSGQVGAHQHTFCSYLKTSFKQKFRPKYA